MKYDEPQGNLIFRLMNECIPEGGIVVLPFVVVVLVALPGPQWAAVLARRPAAACCACCALLVVFPLLPPSVASASAVVVRWLLLRRP